MNFPEILKSKKQWIVWRLEEKQAGKKPTKVPYYTNGKIRSGRQGDEQDLSNLDTFESAKKALGIGRYDGLGFCIIPGDGLACLDIDSNADMQQAQEIMQDLNSYTEVSPSGMGYHIWVQTDTEDTFKSNDLGLEFFAKSQFLTMTAKQVDGYPFEVRRISDFKVNALRAIIKPEIKTKDKTQKEYQSSSQEFERKKLESAVMWLSSECGYDDWYRVGAAIYSELGPLGFSLWDFWSSRSSKYVADGMRGKYDSFANIHDIKAATIYKMACDQGWKPPRDPNWKPEPYPTPVLKPDAVSVKTEQKMPKNKVTDPFKFLGYDRDVFYVFQYEKNQICELKKGDLSETGFLTLANEQYWALLFPAKSGFDKRAATDWFIRKCYAEGIFNPDVVRGRGAWWDDDRVVFHFGSKLWVNGEVIEVGDIESKYIYEVARTMQTKKSEALSFADGRKILQTAKMFRWQKPASAPLLCGWMFLSRICGALNWRPHIWVTGESGSGKTTIMNSFIYPLLGNDIVFAQGNSTEAGIRQKLKNDAIPVLFDEAESNNDREQNRIQNILSLIRQSSTDSGAHTYKGTATGDAMHFFIRSMFMLSSIQVHILMQADMERITVLNLVPKRQENAADNWKKLSKNLLDIGLDKGISDRMFARSLVMLPTVLKNIEVFRVSAAKFFGTVREGDQYGTLLAGCWSLCEDREATEQDAIDMINKLDWSEYKDNAEDTESKKTLSSILESKIKIPHGEASLYEVVNIAINGVEMMQGIDLSQSEAHAVLQRHGMKLDDKGLLISNNTQSVTNMLRGSQYQSDWKGQILRIEGVSKYPKPVRFNGIVSRCIHIDLSLLGL